jgi:hypothetical protein
MYSTCHARTALSVSIFEVVLASFIAMFAVSDGVVDTGRVRICYDLHVRLFTLLLNIGISLIAIWLQPASTCIVYSLLLYPV